MRRRSHSFDFLFILVVFAMLALVSVLMISMGSGIYQNVLDTMHDNDSQRTATAYITQKVRQNQAAGAIRVEEVDGIRALAIYDEIDGASYVTYLYCKDGELKELMTPAGNESISASSGTRIMDLSSLSFDEASKRQIHVHMITDEGKPVSFLINLAP